MAKAIALLDTWGVMAITCFYMAMGILSWHALLYYRTGSLENVLLCLVGGGLGLTLFISLNAVRRAMWIRVAMIVVVTLILWFQRTPWFGIDDSAIVRHSFIQEHFRQRLVQIGDFMLFALPFACVGIVRRSRVPCALSTEMNIKRTSQVSLIVIALIPILCGLVLRLIGGTPDQQVIQAIIEGTVTLMSLLFLARRAERADKGVSGALAAVAIGAPIVAFWR